MQVYCMSMCGVCLRTYNNTYATHRVESAPAVIGMIYLQTYSDYFWDRWAVGKLKPIFQNTTEKVAPERKNRWYA